MVTRKYSCWNAERMPAYWVQDGWVSHTDSNGLRIQARKMRLHTDDMSRECQYRKGVSNDPQCEGCAK